LRLTTARLAWLKMGRLSKRGLWMMANGSCTRSLGGCRYERVLRWIAELIAEIAVSPAQRALLETAFVGLDRNAREAAAAGGGIPSIELPLAVYAAVTGEEDAAVPLAAACALVFLGLDLFDDLADGDRQAHWAGHSAAEINLAAATVLCVLPPLILARLDIAPARRLRMQQILAEGLLRISAGQQVDLALTGAQEPTVAEVEAAIIGKSGEQSATYCALAAEMAGATPQALALYTELGREISTARQFVSDCHDVLIDPECRDLAHGTRSMPIVAHINRLTGAERLRFLDLLDQARTDRRAQEAVRRELRATAEIRRVMFAAQLRLVRARAIVRRIGASEPGKARLLQFIAFLSDDRHTG